MAYNLVIKEKNNYKLLDITNLEKFNRISQFKNNVYSLEEIDKFTSLFNNEIELKKYLYINKIITYEDIIKIIYIRMNNKDNVKYGITYKNSIKYFDEEYLKHKIQSLSTNEKFLKKLTSYYRNSYLNNYNIYSINAYLINKYDIDNINKILEDFIVTEIFSIDTKTGELKIKYKSFHDLAMFVHNFIDQNNDTKRKIELLKLQKEILLEQTPKQKVKIKTDKRVLEGQISMFDEM